MIHLNQVISLSSLKDKIDILYNFSSSNPGVVNNLSVTIHDHNYWPCPNVICKQSFCSSCFIPLFNAH